MLAIGLMCLMIGFNLLSKRWWTYFGVGSF